MKQQHKPYIIVLGNEKGGTGKSTLSMHVIVSLLRQGYRVGTIDVDARQGTLSRYIENRSMRAQATNEDLPLPQHYPIFKSEMSSLEEAQQDETERFNQTMAYLASTCQFIVIDTPGSDSYLSRLAHSHADTLITPLNDSFIDLDMIVRVNADLTILKPSTYSEMVWEQKKSKAIRSGGTIDWIVVRNRMSNVHSRNREEMEKVLKALAKRIGFRFIPGFSERVIFRELFLSGLTLLDMKQAKMTMSLSHLSAKQELSLLIDAIQLPTHLKLDIAS